MRLSKQQFVKWLKQKHPRTKVGIPGSLEQCPLANYLKFIYPMKFLYVLDHTFVIEYNRIGHQYILPKWAQKYVAEVDQLQKQKSISAAAIIKLLERC